MSEKRLTFFELHTHGDIQFGPASLPGDDGANAAQSPTVEPDAAEETEGGSLLGLLVALGVLVVVALAIKKLTGDDGEAVDLAESDDL